MTGNKPKQMTGMLFGVRNNKLIWSFLNIEFNLILKSIILEDIGIYAIKINSIEILKDISKV